MRPNKSAGSGWHTYTSNPYFEEEKQTKITFENMVVLLDTDENENRTTGRVLVEWRGGKEYLYPCFSE